MNHLEKKNHGAQARSGKKTPGPLRRRHILVVDDEAHFRFATGIALRRAGYTITEAADAEEALLLLTKAPGAAHFDLMLVDVQMPGMSGVELIEEIRGRGIGLPAFIISGFVDKRLAEELSRKGCKDLLHKPFEPAELVRRVTRLIEGAGAEEEYPCPA
jgi:CheY-like chemotaxis protein